MHSGRRRVRSLTRFGISRPRRRVHRRPAGPTSAPAVGQLGQSALSLPFLRPLRSEVVAYTKDGDETDQEAGEAHGLIHAEGKGRRQAHISGLLARSKSIEASQGTLYGNKAFHAHGTSCARSGYSPQLLRISISLSTDTSFLIFRQRERGCRLRPAAKGSGYSGSWR